MKMNNLARAFIALCITFTSAYSDDHRENPTSYGVYLNKAFSPSKLSGYIHQINPQLSESEVVPLDLIKSYDAKEYGFYELNGDGFPESPYYRVSLEFADSSDANRVASTLSNVTVGFDYEMYCTYQWLINPENTMSQQEANAICENVSQIVSDSYLCEKTNVASLLVFALELDKGSAAALVKTLTQSGVDAKMQLMEYYERDL